MSTPYCMDCGKSGADLALTRIHDRPTCGPCLLARWEKVCEAAEKHGHQGFRISPEAFRGILAHVAELEASAVPPYLRCEMCGDVNCCDGEWFDGSELRCHSCGREGSMEEHLHSSGYTHWVLVSLYDEDDEPCSDASCATCRAGEPCQ